MRMTRVLSRLLIASCLIFSNHKIRSLSKGSTSITIVCTAVLMSYLILSGHSV